MRAPAPPSIDDAFLRGILAEARTIAVLGAHVDELRPAFYVPDYLYAQGYRVLPVNPVLAGQTRWNEPFQSRLDAIDEPVDVVDVFRRSDLVEGHVEEILAMRYRPRVVWMQLGVSSRAASTRLIDAGIDVVEDRCTLADHRRLGVVRIERNDR
jgi:hypothetical protein